MTHTLDAISSNSTEDWNTTFFNSSRDLLHPPYPYYQQNITYVDLYLHKPSVVVVFIVSYLLIFLVCMVGNGVVCFIVLRSKNMRTVTNLFILNLAISDLLVGIFCMPTTLVDNIITGWPFGRLVCKLSGMVQGISVSASVFTLVAIAVDRFRCIVYPFKQKLTISTSTLIIIIIWVLAISIMCPSGVMLQVTKEQRVLILLGDGYNNTRPFYWCRENWPNQEMRKIYTTVLFANIYLAPLSLIVIMYARIGFTLFKTAVPSSGGCSGSGSSGGTKPSLDNHRQSKKKKRVIKMLLVVALLFILSWLPLWTLMMLSDYASLTASQHRIINIYVYPLAHWLAFFNSSVNPIIYGFFNENFRRGFQAAFKFQLCSAVMERQKTYSHRIQGNAVLPANLHLPTGPGSGGSELALVNRKGLGREEVVGRTSGGRSSESDVKEQDLIMEDLEKVIYDL
ncbi:neuropeptide FF receptor 2 [Salmo salar]|uniref:Neuropeptide FF receptor 2 n=2 Tax=Salmo TaxID=8028 RepID=A0A674CZU0_SALTR|nr:neuropeptide FF receptor 2-like [Salmo salar]XP_029565797.1 neuropeptide FF receptor 2-like [Salmo trutta]|eukprot:XP_013996372.1 PREDICTED: neuropeptide FF receptor 2-like [Salmo salar]